MMPSKKPVKKSETITATTASRKSIFPEAPPRELLFYFPRKKTGEPRSLFFSLPANEGVQQLQRMPIFHCHGVSTSPPKVLITSAYT